MFVEHVLIEEFKSKITAKSESGTDNPQVIWHEMTNLDTKVVTIMMLQSDCTSTCINHPHLSIVDCSTQGVEPMEVHVHATYSVYINIEKQKLVKLYFFVKDETELKPGTDCTKQFKEQVPTCNTQVSNVNTETQFN